jgi:copper chaperone CopZ
MFGGRTVELVVDRSVDRVMAMAAIEIAIEGMTCGGCVTSLKKVLAREGLDDVTVEVGVARLAREGDVPRVKAAIEKAGFTAGEARTPADNLR